MFNPNEHMINLKGKDYLQVMWRLVWFREEHPDYGISTEALSITDDHAVFRAVIFDNSGAQLSCGHGSESKRDFGDFIEKAETKAVGRCLAMLGYGTQFAADELDEGQRIVDSPVERKPQKAAQKPKEVPKKEDAKAYRCEACGKEIGEFKSGGRILPLAEGAEICRSNYGKVLCADCRKVARAAKKPA